MKLCDTFCYSVILKVILKVIPDGTRPADRDDCVLGRRAYFTTHTFTTLGPVVIMLIKIVMVVSLIAVTQGHR